MRCEEAIECEAKYLRLPFASVKWKKYWLKLEYIDCLLFCLSLSQAIAFAQWAHLSLLLFCFCYYFMVCWVYACFCSSSIIITYIFLLLLVIFIMICWFFVVWAYVVVTSLLVVLNGFTHFRFVALLPCYHPFSLSSLISIQFFQFFSISSYELQTILTMFPEAQFQWHFKMK